jgi:hypothetical protein
MVIPFLPRMFSLSFVSSRLSTFCGVAAQSYLHTSEERKQHIPPSLKGNKGSNICQLMGDLSINLFFHNIVLNDVLCFLFPAK